MKFEDILIDPEKVTLLTGNTVVIDDVGKQRISVKAADALREWLRPLELHRLKAQQERSCRDSSQQTAKLHKGHRIGLMTTKGQGMVRKMKKPAERRGPQEGHRWPSNTDAANYTTPII